jgi:hypothetical protein
VTRYADIVRRLLSGRRSEPPPALPADRRRLVAAIDEALRARSRRRAALRRGLSVGLAGAAVLALFVASRRLRPSEIAGDRAVPGAALTVLEGTSAGGRLVAPDGATKPAIGGMAVGAGFRLVGPPEGPVGVGTPDGSQLTLEPRAELAFLELGATRRFSLRAGVVSVRVARLFASERFIVATADAEIEGRGSTFRVALVAPDPTCGDGSLTRVSVSEGNVSVRSNGHEVRVQPGEHWPQPCTAAATPDRRPSRLASAARRPTPASAAPPAPETTPRLPAAASSLAVENDLFAEAVRAKNAGRLAPAALAFGRLIDEHPKSPLVESAMVQRLRLLSTLDPAAAARLANEYLSRFPAGVARPEAERLAARPAP